MEWSLFTMLRIRFDRSRKKTLDVLFVIQESFIHVKGWLQDIDRYCRPDVMKLIVGNKCDLKTKRVVEYAEAKVKTKSKIFLFIVEFCRLELRRFFGNSVFRNIGEKFDECRKRVYGNGHSNHVSCLVWRNGSATENSEQNRCQNTVETC